MSANTLAELDQLAAETLRQVEGQFREMPGLRLTEIQAARLFSLDATTCGSVLRRLVAAGFLIETRGVTFARADEVRRGA